MRKSAPALKWKGLAMDIQAAPGLERGFRPLEGRVSLVTGSTSGIGLGIARALAGAGSAVVLNGFVWPLSCIEERPMSGELILVQSARRPSDRHPLLDELVRIWRSLRNTFLDPYRPELHYMRGPGPKCREKELQRNLALQKAFHDGVRVRE